MPKTKKGATKVAPPKDKLTLLRQQLKENSEVARDAVRAAGASLNPRIAAARAKISE